MMLAIPILSATPARAGVLWYNGDYDNRDALDNGTSGIFYNTGFIEVSKVYDNFTVPTGQTWTISSVFSDDQIFYQGTSNVVKTATWAIRQGISAGVGGTLVAGGDTSATQAALPMVAGDYYAANPYQITATVPSVVLAAGTYWLSVIPDDSDTFYRDESYVMTTSGLNSVGSPMGNDGNSFLSNNLTAAGSYNFTPTSSNSVEGPGNWDYSMGVSGVVSLAVPEPSSLILMAVGCFGAPAIARLRSRNSTE